MAKRNTKVIYRIQIEHDMPGSYFHTAKEANAAWNEASEPLEYKAVDPVEVCEQLEEVIEDKQREIDRLIYALSELLSVTRSEVIVKTPEGSRAVEALRIYDKSEAQDIDRRVQEYKEEKEKKKP